MRRTGRLCILEPSVSQSFEGADYLVSPSIGVSDSGGCFSWDSPVDPPKRLHPSSVARCCAKLAGHGISSRMRDLHAESGIKDLICNDLRSGKLPPPTPARSDRSFRFQVTSTRLGQLYASGTVTGYGPVVPRPCKACPTEHCSFWLFSKSKRSATVAGLNSSRNPCVVHDIDIKWNCRKST